MLPHILFVILLIAGIILSVSMRKLTRTGGVTGGMLALCIYLGAGYTGIAMLGLFFVLGTLATLWGIKRKQQMGVAEYDQGRRTAGQVLANGGVAALMGLIAWLYPAHTVICNAMMAAALASATSDTLSSELGTVYGKRFYNIITLEKDIRGENGVVSVEGLLAGILGSVVITLVHAVGFGFSNYTIWIIIAGTAGNLFDSVLGATLERKHYVGNNFVNFLNTMAGAATMLIFLM